MTKEELAGYDGEQGRKAYVAVNNKIYDVTTSRYWQGGNHQNAHRAGSDLSNELLDAPHVRSVIERFPVVAELEEDSVEVKKGTGGKTVIIIGAVLIAALLTWFLLR